MGMSRRGASSTVRAGINLVLLAIPWRLRRTILRLLWGYQLHPTSRIGFSWVFPDHLVMGPGSRIGNLTVCRGLGRVALGKQSVIGNWNWITREAAETAHLFSEERERESALLLKDYAVITSRHYIDCTNTVTVGEATVVAGIRTSVFSHSVSIHRGDQGSKPVRIGECCFVGTNCVLLPGAVLPDFSVLSALSVLTEAFDEPNTRYSGSPAKPVERYTSDAAYFGRKL